MVIGTQNPITMAGRRPTGTALSMRLTTLTVPDYPEKEMVSILEQKGLNHYQANALVTAYQNQCQVAKDKHYKPAPTFRDLLRIADKIKSHQSLADLALNTADPLQHIMTSFKSNDADHVESVKKFLDSMGFVRVFQQIHKQIPSIVPAANKKYAYYNATYTLMKQLTTAAVILFDPDIPLEDRQKQDFKKRALECIRESTPVLGQYSTLKAVLNVLSLALRGRIKDVKTEWQFFKKQQSTAKDLLDIDKSLRSQDPNPT